MKTPKCTPKLVAKLADDIREGASLKNAAEAVGISERQLRHWRTWADEGKEPYASLVPVLKKAIGEAKAKAERRIARGELRWESSARWLESIDPDQWRRTERRQVDLRGEIRLRHPDPTVAGADGVRAAFAEDEGESGDKHDDDGEGGGKPGRQKRG